MSSRIEKSVHHAKRDYRFLIYSEKMYQEQMERMAYTEFFRQLRVYELQTFANELV